MSVFNSFRICLYCLLYFTLKCPNLIDLYEEEDLKLNKDKIVTNAKGLINEIKDIKRMTKDEKDKLDIVEKHGSKKQAFLAVHANKRVLTDFENRVSAITETTSKCTIKLNTKSVKKDTVSIGIIETIEVPPAIEFVQKKKHQPQFPVKQTHGLSSFGKMQSILNTGLYESIFGVTLNGWNVQRLSGK